MKKIVNIYESNGATATQSRLPRPRVVKKWWRNFVEPIRVKYGVALQSIVVEELAKHNATRDILMECVIFDTEQDYVMFVLKWS